MHDELLDLVDTKDKVISQLWRSQVCLLTLHNYRTVKAFVRNSNGKLCIPRRTGFRKMFPFCLDVSISGNVKGGESYEEAIARVTRELGIEVESNRITLLGKIDPHQHGVSSYMSVYEINSDKDPGYDSHDYACHYWLAPSEALVRMAGGDPGNDDLYRLLQIFYISKKVTSMVQAAPRLNDPEFRR